MTLVRLGALALGAFLLGSAASALEVGAIAPEFSMTTLDGRKFSLADAEKNHSAVVVLFLSTLLTTTLAGAFQAGVNPFVDWRLLTHGLPFSITLMSILLVHEMGHFVVSRWHGVEATPPYFIPGPPFLIGTFGAFIRMRTPTNRTALFDVGAAGPWAGFFVAIPAVLYGLAHSQVRSNGSFSTADAITCCAVFAFCIRLRITISTVT